jgi:hypothetical protein
MLALQLCVQHVTCVDGVGCDHVAQHSRGRLVPSIRHWVASAGAQPVIEIAPVAFWRGNGRI